MPEPERRSRKDWLMRFTAGSTKTAKERMSKDRGSKNPTNWRPKREDRRRARRR
jgi:hypothetical protein